MNKQPAKINPGNMKKSLFLIPLLVMLPFASSWCQLQLRTDYFQLALNEKGYVTSLYDLVNAKEFINMDSGNTANPLLVLHDGNNRYLPSSMAYDQAENLITLDYGSGAIRAKIRLETKPTHISFELIAVSDSDPVAVQWGAYACAITSIIGETIGVVRDGGYAIGIQALNMHTMGGVLHEYYPVTNAGEGIFREADHSRAATLVGQRSELRAYTREMEGGIRNSKIALFGCPAGMLPDLLGKIELAEDLPHPLFNGIWGKVAPVMKENWMMTDFNEANIDEIIDFARKANLTSIHTMSPFETWGHFRINKKNFPNGLDGIKACVDKAARFNISLGIHSLSNFITTNDPYVTPVPDHRLACDIKTDLLQELDLSDKTVFIRDTADFGNYAVQRGSWIQGRKNHLKTIRIDNELIKYESVAAEKPFRLINCQRGAYGTVAASHQAGAVVGKLWDHDYHVFFPSLEMQKEMALRLADIINYTGLKEISFDGLEGCFFSGHGMYASVQFVKDCLEHIDHEIFCDASIINHNLWHYFSRMTWGDENYESATRVGDLKFRNQAFYSRNFIPPMMGAGLKLTTHTRNRLASTVDDAEWQLSKNAGYDAGYGIGTNLHTIRNLGNLDDIIRICNSWEEARALNAFSRDQRNRLSDPAGEWHLEKVAEKQWMLGPVEFHEFDCQANAPDRSSFEFVNKYDQQNLQMTMHISAKTFEEKTSVTDPCITLNGQEITFPVTLYQNQYLVYQSGEKGLVFDENWHFIKEIEVRFKDLPAVIKGEQVFSFRTATVTDARVSIRIKTSGKQELVKAG